MHQRGACESVCGGSFSTGLVVLLSIQANADLKLQDAVLQVSRGGVVDSQHNLLLLNFCFNEVSLALLRLISAKTNQDCSLDIVCVCDGAEDGQEEFIGDESFSGAGDAAEHALPRGVVIFR